MVVVGPGGAGRDVDFEDAGVAGEADGGEGRIGGRGVAGEDDVGEFEGDEGGLNVGEELEVGGEQERRDKDDEGAIADLRGEGAAEIFFAELAEREAEAGGAFAGEQGDGCGGA